MTIIVTGGAGFIGANFILYMLKKYPSYNIICIDKLTYAGNLENLAAVLNNVRFKFIHADICERKIIYAIFAQYKPDIVVNFAAESHVDRSIVNPEVFLKTNIMGTEVLLSACKKYLVKRYHQISTDEVYGDLPLDKTDLSFTEEMSLKTSSPYSASKAGGDLLVMSYFKTYNLPITISRSSNNYGPYQFPEKLIPLMIVKALENKPLPVYGNGLNIRDWLYVEDHCRAVDIIIHQGKIGEIYNIGANNEMSNIEIVKLLCQKLGKSEALITYVADRQGHDLRYALNTDKIKKELGWHQQTDFITGMDKTIKWYLTNYKWWQRIISGEYKSYNAKILEEQNNLLNKDFTIT